jgi:hypothetical protein
MTSSPSRAAARESNTLRNIRRETVVCVLAWVAAAAYCCLASYVLGYQRPDRPLSRVDVHPIAGIPAWFVWGVLAPWAFFAVVNLWFALRFMSADDLGEDQTAELEREIHESGSLAEGENSTPAGTGRSDSPGGRDESV